VASLLGRMFFCCCAFFWTSLLLVTMDVGIEMCLDCNLAVMIQGHSLSRL
jgi:hypothetical protein